MPSTSGLLFRLLPRINPQIPGPLVSSSPFPAPSTVSALRLPRAEDALSKSGVAARRRLSRVEGRRWRGLLSLDVCQMGYYRDSRGRIRRTDKPRGRSRLDVFVMAIEATGYESPPWDGGGGGGGGWLVGMWIHGERDRTI